MSDLPSHSHCDLDHRCERCVADERARIRTAAVKRAVTGDADVLILTLGALFVITGGEGSNE